MMVALLLEWIHVVQEKHQCSTSCGCMFRKRSVLGQQIRGGDQIFMRTTSIEYQIAGKGLKMSSAPTKRRMCRLEYPVSPMHLQHVNHRLKVMFSSSMLMEFWGFHCSEQTVTLASTHIVETVRHGFKMMSERFE